MLIWCLFQSMQSYSAWWWNTCTRRWFIFHIVKKNLQFFMINDKLVVFIKDMFKHDRNDLLLRNHLIWTLKRTRHCKFYWLIIDNYCSLKKHYLNPENKNGIKLTSKWNKSFTFNVSHTHKWKINEVKER